MAARLVLLQLALGPLLVLLTAVSSGEAQPSETADGETDSYCLPPVDWRCLYLFECRVTKMELVLHGTDAVPLGRGIGGRNGLHVETESRDVMETIQSFLNTPLRVAFPDDPKLAVGMADFTFHLGTMTVTTSRHEFVVGITSKGFTLGTDFQGPRNVFYSWGLAKEIDRILSDQNSEHLPAELFSVLSGEAIIAGERRLYKLLRERHSHSLNPKSTPGSAGGTDDSPE